jgi:hypothetical protein
MDVDTLYSDDPVFVPIQNRFTVDSFRGHFAFNSIWQVHP